jgi:hypothetical protein
VALKTLLGLIVPFYKARRKRVLLTSNVTYGPHVSGGFLHLSSSNVFWNFFNLPSLSLRNRAISESAFLVLKTHALQAFLRTNTEPQFSSFLRLNQLVLTAQPVGSYGSTSAFLRLNQFVLYDSIRSSSVRFYVSHRSVSVHIPRVTFCPYTVHTQFVTYHQV